MSDADCADSLYMYEQGELEPSPEAEHRVKGRHLSLSPHSQETIDDDIIIIKDRDDVSDHGDELDIKPPQSHAGKKERSHKHRHKEERRREKEHRSHVRRDRIERSEREAHDNRGFPSHVEVPRGHHSVHSHDRREFKDVSSQHVRNPARGRAVERDHKADRERVADDSQERRLRDESKEAREVRKRQESLDERDRLERLERERQRERKLREERIRKLEERAVRAKRKEEERRNVSQSRVEDRNKRSRNERSVRDRSHSEDRHHQRDVEKNVEKLRLKRKEPVEQRMKVVGPHTPPEDDFPHHKQDEMEEVEDDESEEEEEEESEEEEEEEEEEKEEVEEEETPNSESVSESDSDTSSESQSESSAPHSEADTSETAVIKHEKVKSKFDHSEDESETESPLPNDQEHLNFVQASPHQSPVEEVSHLPLYFPAIQGCRNVEEFHCLNRIEEGTYGVVYRARDKKTNEIVALKRLKMEKEKEGFPITALREINTLLKSQHVNIVTVREIVVGSNMDKIYLVMDYVEHDLKRLMESMKSPFLSGEVKTLMQQLLRAVIHLHDNWILHRDLKTSNLLLSHRGILKVGDFGLAREYGSPLKNYTPIVVTLWYRAPELLLGIKQYSCPVDLWSVGCIFAELLTMKALWPGKSEIDQLNRIFKDLGTPNKKIWPGVEDLPVMKKCTFTDYAYNTLRNRFGSYLSDLGFDLLNKFLTYCPQRRITAEDALKHEYFKEAPLPVDPSMFPTWPAKSEQQPRKHQSSPKPPSGGKAYAKLLDDEESMGFHMSNAVKGASAQGPGFSLKF